jgi:hypothetical protein
MIEAFARSQYQYYFGRDYSPGSSIRYDRGIVFSGNFAYFTLNSTLESGFVLSESAEVSNATWYIRVDTVCLLQ